MWQTRYLLTLWTVLLVARSEVTEGPSVVEVGKVSGGPRPVIGGVSQQGEVNNRFFLPGIFDSCSTCSYYKQNQARRCCYQGYQRCCSFAQQGNYYPNNNNWYPNNNGNWYPNNGYPNNNYPNNYPTGFGKPGYCPNYYGRGGGRGVIGNKRIKRKAQEISSRPQESDRRQFGYDYNSGRYPGGGGGGGGGGTNVYYQCSQDYDCPGSLKCCSSGFYRQCTYPGSPYYGSGGSGFGGYGGYGGYGGQNYG